MQAMQAGPPPGTQPLPPAGNPPPMGPPQLQMGPPPPTDAMSQGIFSNPTMPSGPPSLLPGEVPPGIAPAEGGYRSLDFGQTNGIPQGGTLEAGAGGVDSLGAGIEKAMKFMMKNATPLSLGAQAVSALSGQGQQGQKRSTFKPGYRLSPNFKPTLAPSAPSGVYGSAYNRRMAEGGIASDAEQPDYEPNVARYAQGGIASYATGGKTFGEQMAERMAAQADAPVAKATTTAPASKATAVAPGTQGAGTQSSNFMTNPIGVLTGVLGREPTTAELQAGLAATKAGQPITAATLKATTTAPAAKATTTTATASKSMPDAMATVEKALGLAPGTATIQQIMAADKAYKAGQPITAETLKANMPATTTGGGATTTTGGGATTTGGGATTTGTAPMTVADLYTTYFKRPADAGGLASWTAQFGNEVDAAELQTFLNAQSTKDEIAGLGGTTKPVTNTTTTDTTTTPRDPNVNPLSTSTAGTSGTYAHDMQGNIYNTATGVRVTQEEAARAAIPAFDINALYRKYLDRNADESGIKTYDPSKYTAQQVSDYLMGSEEYKKQTLDPDEIQSAYRKVLQRNVDPSGASGYLGQNYSAGAFEDFLKKSQEYKEEVPFRTMERTIYKPEYEDYTKNPITSVPGMAIPDKLSYAAIQNQLGGTPTYDDVVRSSAVFEANKPTTPGQYMAMAKKGETGMAAGGSAEDKDSALQAKYAKLQGIKTDQQTQADIDDLVAYQKRMNEMGINTDDDLDTRLLDPYSAAQVRLAKVGKKYKVPVAEMPKTGTNLATMAQGGITQNLGGYSDGGHLLKGPGDGMSDHIPAMIGKRQPARLADGEFVIPADVVSHLGNGSTEAGAKQLYAMMSRIRKARTGNSKQGKQVNPRKLMPK